jgi:hypothetical protein
MSAEGCDSLYRGWQEAVRRAHGWAAEGSKP